MSTDWQALVTRFRPIYKLHSEEMFYPVHVEDVMFYNLSLVKVSGTTVTTLVPGQLDADIALATDKGLAELKSRGIALDAGTIADLRPKPTSSPAYNWLQLDDRYLFKYRPDPALTPPLGFLWSEHYAPRDFTWYHRGAPNAPCAWLPFHSQSQAQWAASMANPGPAQCAFKEPIVAGWVQRHTVAGVDYIDIIYTAYLPYNGSISMVAGQGEHFNDVETNVVRLRADDPATPVRYYYQQHGGCAWYDPQHVTRVGDQVVVYLARQSHECYPTPGRFTRLYGIADDVCDDAGITWTPDAVWLNRPQGVDANGIDTDALRCQVNPGNPNSVVLIPANDPGPLWQYVPFRYIQNGGDGINNDLISQGAPIFSTKWWPPEGPAGSGPLATKAGEPSGPGVPDAFFGDVAPYLGPNPLPACGSRPAFAAARIAGDDQPPAVAEAPECSLADLLQALAGGPPMLDWTGAVGTYILGGVRASAIPDLLASLPDPLVIPSPWKYQPDPSLPPIELTDINVHGLRSLAIDTFVASGPQTWRMEGVCPLLTADTSLVSGGLPLATVKISASDVKLVMNADVLTPLAVPAGEPSQWYVPYVGPLPYSFPLAGHQDYAHTKTVSHAAVPAGGLTIELASLHVDLGGVIEWLLPFVGKIADALANWLRNVWGAILAAGAAEAFNGALDDLYSGKMRIG
jgi:hypothetical protein